MITSWEGGTCLLSFLSHFSSHPHPQTQTAGREPHPCRARLQADTHRGTSSTSSSRRTRGSNFSLRSGEEGGTKVRDEGCGSEGALPEQSAPRKQPDGGWGLWSPQRPAASFLVASATGIEKDTYPPPFCFPQWPALPGLCCLEGPHPHSLQQLERRRVTAVDQGEEREQSVAGEKEI